MDISLSRAIRSGLLSSNINAYSDSAALHKSLFHKDGKFFLRQLAAALGLTSGSYDIRSNVAGVAVSGEITLHHERLYVQLSESCIRPGVSILYRACEGRKDYCGAANQFVAIQDLLAPERQERFLAHCRGLLQRTSVAA